MCRYDEPVVILCGGVLHLEPKRYQWSLIDGNVGNYPSQNLMLFAPLAVNICIRS